MTWDQKKQTADILLGIGKKDWQSQVKDSLL